MASHPQGHIKRIFIHFGCLQVNRTIFDVLSPSNVLNVITIVRYLLPVLVHNYYYATEAANSRPLAESGSDSESDGEVGAQAPPLTKQISNILNRYPEGGQILKVRIQYG